MVAIDVQQMEASNNNASADGDEGLELATTNPRVTTHVAKSEIVFRLAKASQVVSTHAKESQTDSTTPQPQTSIAKVVTTSSAIDVSQAVSRLAIGADKASAVSRPTETEMSLSTRKQQMGSATSAITSTAITTSACVTNASKPGVITCLTQGKNFGYLCVDRVREYN